MHTVAAVAARSTLESLESLNKDSALCSTPALPIAHAKECVSETQACFCTLCHFVADMGGF
jgi:hypothetical protein